MNTVLLVLVQTQDLINYMVSESLQEDLNRNSPSQGQVAEEVTRLLTIVWSRKFRYGSPHLFRSVVSARHRDLDGMRM